MNEPCKRRQDAIDISDFVYAATGARVRRLTMPDGTHWFPAVDVCAELGHTNSRKALADHVPEDHREILETVTGGYGLSVPAGREWRRDLNLISLQGLLHLVNACTKPSCAPFKQWAAEVIATVQQEGSYSLQKAEVQPTAPGAPVVYAMPAQVADAIVRLEEHNLRIDEELATAQQESLSLQREMLAMQRENLTAQQSIAEAMNRIATRFDTLALASPNSPHPTTESVLADWRRRLSVTEDVWTLAVVIAPVLVEEGELRQPLKSLAARTGLTVHRVNECLRLLRTHACIRSRGATEEGAPVYVLN
ncbi:Bro-N domain-containing protein [Streptomyces acidiscabies]|uniref:Bro-N domain-containing protein n=1 Tax=Streptomyces acidiscabies TaxID=42234 RepID=A0AAP6BJ84_9ACTN|nr:Bro-N domain-containing protein [Streptomyces acidiscabies]MBP5938214.1 Bro-N domain-containing protein [Streptomyces sp. LBUM 1476]MBZ3909232.1 Bro-N domain-containing protein [Streptomyces acidiscabies]MDX2965716.1 Bro-N domain-containing protein [Streptomyces acidiscabies]MDX3016361.1 Bro-N domain-containing protein [Streptomyces acidiscabies]MDX3788733.1 Bro-N domain-containing protein [Streptomyces acidiscabies]